MAVPMICHELAWLMPSFSTSQGGWKPGSDLRDEPADSGRFLVHEDAKAASRILELAGQAHPGELSPSAGCMTAITRHREHGELPHSRPVAGRDTREQSHGFCQWHRLPLRRAPNTDRRSTCPRFGRCRLLPGGWRSERRRPER